MTRTESSTLVLSLLTLGSLLLTVSSQVINEKEDIIIGFDPVLYTVSESEGRIALRIVSSIPIPNTNSILLSIKTRDGTAKLGEDYRDFTDHMIFGSGEHEKLYQTIDVFEDGVVEETLQTFFVRLEVVLSVDASQRILLREREATIFIKDSDLALFELVPTIVPVKEDDQTVVLEVLKSGITQRPITIQVFTRPGTATELLDFIPQSTTLEFLPEQTRSSITINMVDDSTLELDEYFTVELSSDKEEPVLLVDGSSISTVFILNDDNVMFHFNKDFYIVNEGSNVEVHVIRNGSADIPVTVHVESVAVDAIDNKDFKPVSTILTFEPDDTIQSVAIVILDDEGQVDLPRRFMVNLMPENPGVIIGEPRHVTIVILDDDSVTIDFEQREYSVNEADGSVTLTLVKVGINGRSILVYMATMDETAQAMLDYTSYNKMLTFQPETNNITVVIPIHDDIIAEGREMFGIQLIPVSKGVEFGESKGKVKVHIVDDDASMDPTNHICTIENDIIITPFLSRNTYTFHSTCEHIVLENCDPDSTHFRVTVDFNGADLAIQTLGIQINGGTVLVMEDLSVKVENIGDVVRQNDDEKEYESGLIVFEGVNTSTITVLKHGVTITRTRTEVSTLIIATSAQTSGNVCGLCGSLDGVLLYSNRDDVLPVDHVRSEVESFARSWQVNPGEEVLGRGGEECGFLHNDTIIGDPLFSAPIHDINGVTPVISSTSNSDPPFLCYEIHGAPNRAFNLISDRCTSVNALYSAMDVPGNGNIISDIGVNAVDETGSCVQVTVSVRDQCTPRVRLSNGTVISGRGFSGGGVSVSKRRSDRVRISVPNCEGVKLVMWVVCEVEGGQEMLRFVVSRGVNLHPTSHGLVGQFWNVPISISPLVNVTHPLPSQAHLTDIYSISVQPPSGRSRTFLGELYYRSWDRSRVRCYYVGSSQGGVLNEYSVQSDSVIEGVYKDYIVTDGLLGSKFRYSQFDDEVCQ